MPRGEAAPKRGEPLTPREKVVLEEVVRLYVKSGEPVSSRQVAKSSGLGLCSATIRNTMAEMEEKGYLTRPHPSAGRVPTDKSLKLWVERLVEKGKVPPRVLRWLRTRLERHARDVREDPEWILALLARATHEAAMIVRPMGEGPSVLSLTLVPVSRTKALGVVVLTDGTVIRKVVDLGTEITPAELEKLASSVLSFSKGKSLDQLSEATESQKLSEKGKRVVSVLFGNPLEEAEVLLAGTEWLLDAPEFSSGDRIRYLFEAVGDKITLLKTLRRELDEKATGVIIGEDSELTSPGELALVVTVFRCGGKRAGAVGVVGPKRMDYETVVPVVRYMANAVTRMLDDQMGADDE